MNKEQEYDMKAVVLGWCGAFPRKGCATNSVLISTKEGDLLLDCGSGSLSNYFKYSDINRLSGVLISHLHYDHMADIGCLQYSINHAIRVKIIEKKVNVYAPATPLKMWEAIQYPFTVTTALSDRMQIELSGMKITVKKVNHTVECYAFSIEKNGKKIVYLTDTTYLKDAKDFVKDADLLFCEATITEGSRHTIGDGHMTDYEAGRIAAEGNVRKLCPIHLPSDITPRQIEKNAKSVFKGDLCMPDQINTFFV